MNSSHLDKLMGLCFEDLEHMSIRDQREVFKKRACEINRAKHAQYKRRIRGKGAEIFATRVEES
jgi:hypothetical protein